MLAISAGAGPFVVTTNAPKSRVSIFRRYKRLLGALNNVLDAGMIDEETYARSFRLLEERRAQWLRESRVLNPPLSRGRPKNPPKPPMICRKPDCGKLAKPGMVYCSREHAPYGFYGLDPRSVRG